METPLAPLSPPARAVRGAARAVFREDYWRVQIGVTEGLHALRWRRSPLRPVTEAYVERYGLAVRSGPFAGTTYPRASIGFADALVAKLAGAYERELHPAIEALLAGYDPHELVNVGTADGLYAVGLARRVPSLIVHGFDLLPTARRLTRALARANGVLDRFTLYGAADGETLRGLPVRRPLVIADCEGCEVPLIDPEVVPWLAEAAIIVELHDFMAESASTIVPARFARTHDVEIIDARPHYVLEHSEIRELAVTPIEHELAINEFRPARMQWAVMRPKVMPAG